MAKASKIARPLDDPEAAEAARVDETAEVFLPDAHFAVGDARDVMLEAIRSATDWAKFDEARQRDINAAVGNAARTIIGKLVLAISAEGKSQVHATIDQITVKDGLKIVLKGPFNLEALALLGEAQGRAVLLTVADSGSFDHERGPARVSPDQPDIFDEDNDDLAAAGDPPFDDGSPEALRASAAARGGPDPDKQRDDMQDRQMDPESERALAGD